MRTTLKAIESTLLDYLIHEEFEKIELLRKSYPQLNSEIDQYLEVWSLSNKLPKVQHTIDTESALAKVLKQLKD